MHCSLDSFGRLISANVVDQVINFVFTAERKLIVLHLVKMLRSLLCEHIIDNIFAFRANTFGCYVDGMKKIPQRVRTWHGLLLTPRSVRNAGNRSRKIKDATTWPATKMSEDVDMNFAGSVWETGRTTDKKREGTTVATKWVFPFASINFKLSVLCTLVIYLLFCCRRFAPCLASTSLPRRQEAWRRLKQIGSTTHILPCLYSPWVPSINPVSLYHQGNCETFTGEVHALLSAIHEPPACAKIWGADPQRDRRKNGAAPRREGLQNHGSHLFEKFVIYDNCVACLLTHS